ncbi:efflux RND transporter permease subunit [Haliangium sp.]|uniref:efflux RND transporter permease subunit n=1 Tax=Haliangium sp. TaxID=2663208 RepID=UPI003D0AF5EE
MNPGRSILQHAIARPVSVSVGVTLVALFGTLAIVDMPIQLTPDVSVPAVSVSTAWPGATPTEVESELVVPQEEVLESLPGLVRMSSEARRERAVITLELAVGTELDDALVRVSNLLSQVPDYPATARQPIIATADAGAPPLAVLMIQSDPPGQEIDAYRSWVLDTVVPQFQRIPGVADIRVVGGREQEIHVDFDPDALAARGITVGQLGAAIRSEVADVSAGEVSLGKRRVTVRTAVAPSVPEALRRAVLRTSDQGPPVRLGDVATVRMGLRAADEVSFFNGAPALALILLSETGSNVLTVTREIYRVAAEIEADRLAAEGLRIRVVTDQTAYIDGSLTQVRNNIVLGGILAIAVLLLFLRSLSGSVIIALSIPVSVVGTALVMSLLGRSVNVVSLAGMAFAVGMVVDASIVVLESIVAWRDRGIDGARAALLGTRAVWGALLASTCTTAVVFIPIIAWQDEVGQLLRDIGLALSTAVAVSLVVSVVVIPSFAARLMSRTRAHGGARRTGLAAAVEASGPAAMAGVPARTVMMWRATTAPPTAAVTPRYPRIARVVSWIVAMRGRTAWVAGLGVVGVAGVGLALMPPMEYLPTGQRNIVFGIMIPPPGFSESALRATADEVHGRLAAHVGEGREGAPALDRTFFAGGTERILVVAAAEDPTRVGDAVTLVRRVISDVPDTIGVATQGSLFGRRVDGGRAIEVDITGADLGAMTRVGRALAGALRRELSGAQIRPIPGLDLGAPELRVEPRRDQLNRHGLSSADLGLIVDAYIDGAIIGELGREGEPKRDVLLRAQRERGEGRELARPRIDGTRALATTPTRTPAGQVVPVGVLTELRETLGPNVIQRIERRRAITLQISPPAEVAFEDAKAVVEARVAALTAAGEVPDGVDITLGGDAGKLEDAKSRFGGVLVLAVIIVFLLLAALFEDAVAPVAILVTVPLAGAGGVLGLRLVDWLLGPQPLDMISATGFVILIGVVVNNAILMVEGALTRMREQGASLEEAITGAVDDRVRPILMSTSTSLAGLMPLVFFPGAGSELYRGVGSIVLGGLALSTVLSLVLVPAVFTSVWRLRTGRRVAKAKIASRAVTTRL